MRTPIHSLRTAAAAIAALAVTAALAAQGAPSPAPELKALVPLHGNWQGTGTATFAPGAPPAKWEARGTYKLSHGGHFVQEDFEIVFDGMPAPMLIRAYLGWDHENARYVSLVANNSGEVRLSTLAVMPDGTLLQVQMQSQEGMPCAERSLIKVDDKTMRHSIEMLLPGGASLTVIDSTFTREGGGYECAFDAPMFGGKKANADLKRLCKSAGTYQVEGSMVMMPGMPETKIRGTDTGRACWQNSVLHIETVGTAEGMPGEYRGDVFWGRDPVRDCMVGVYVSNFGEVMTMDAQWAKDGKLVATTATKLMGEPSLQRTTMEFDADGHSTKAWSHALIGTNPPLQTFTATYTKK